MLPNKKMNIMDKQYQTFEELTDTATAYMTSLSYNLHMVYLYQLEWRHIGNYMKERGLKEYNTKVGMQYLIETIGEVDYKLLSRRMRRRIRAISCLSDFFTTGSIRKRKLSTFPDELDGDIGNSIAKYIIETAKLNDYAKETVRSHKLYLSRFLKYLNEQDISSFSSFNSVLMVNFPQSLKEYSVTTRHFIILKTIQFLKYLYKQGTLTTDYSMMIPKGKYIRLPKLPSYFSLEEENLILNSIDRASDRGKRDYAMILLTIRLGLRCSDVVHLTFSNILWEQEKITLKQEKTQTIVELPLFPDIGNSIIDYLKCSRPYSESPCVFLSLIPPYNGLNKNSFYGTIQKYLKISGISYDERKHGPHALRHSLASNLLRQNTPLPVISSILGHTNTESTLNYLRVDITSLRKCALSVPVMQIKQLTEGKEIFK